MITPKNTSPPKIKSKEDAKRFRELLKERKYNLKKILKMTRIVGVILF